MFFPKPPGIAEGPDATFGTDPRSCKHYYFFQ
jgi:hypothetical protein